MKNVIAFLLIFSNFSYAERQEWTVHVFSETTTKENNQADPENNNIQTIYKLEGIYTPKNNEEVMIVTGISELHTFHTSEGDHPMIGKPFYLVVKHEGKIHGSVIKCYLDGGSGFYLIKDMNTDDKAGLREKNENANMVPLHSTTFNKLFTFIIKKVLEK